MTQNNHSVTKSLIQEVLDSKKKKKGRYYRCPVCDDYNLWVTNRKFGCAAGDDWNMVRVGILKKAGLWEDYKSDRSQTYQQRYDAPPQYLSEEVKAELAQSWRPGSDPELNKDDPSTYPREIVWALNFSSIKGEGYIRGFLHNSYYHGSMEGWISTMGNGDPSCNQFKPTIPYQKRDIKSAKRCTFWLLTYLATGQIPRGWQQYLQLFGGDSAKYLTSRKGYGALIPKIPYQGPTYWENIKADKSIPLEGLEGAKKTAANLFCLGIPSIGFCGVEMWGIKETAEQKADLTHDREILPEAAELIRDRQDYTIKFDADCLRKPGVLRAIIHHGLAAQKIGATVYVALWDEKYGKGIDDVIASGHDASYGGGIVRKLPFAQFLKENPLPEQEEMQTTFKSFAYKLFQNFRGACQKEVERTIAKAERKTEISDTGKITEYKGSDRLKTWYELKTPLNLDTSFTGSGKSHACGSLNTDRFDAERIIYLHSQHANPPTESLGKWDDLPPRHNGLIASGRKNPDGSPHISWPCQGQTPNIPGNCKYAHLFVAGQEKNVPHEDLKAICNNCEFGKKLDKDGKVESHLCATDEGEGYGYKLARARALLSPNLRAHPASLPPDDDYSQTVLFWDEFDTQFSNSKSFSVTKNKIIQDFAELELKDNALFGELTPIRLVLLEIFALDKIPRYGYSDRELRQRFKAKISESNPTLFATESEWWDMAVVCTTRLFSINLEKEIAAKGLDNLQFPLQWMSDFLRILRNESHGAMTFDKDALTLTIRDDKANNIIKSAKLNIFADATADPGLVAQVLGVSRDELNIIREITPRHDNLKIVQVDFERHITKGDRSNELNHRLDAAHKTLREKYKSQLVTFNYKTNAAEGDLIQFADNRGINHAEKKKALCTVGDPYVHRGAIAVRFQISFGRSPNLDGSDKEFEDYYTNYCQAEVVQMVGRLRAARRQKEDLTYYHFGNLDLSFLQEALPGCQYQRIMAKDLTPDAAPRDIRFKVDLIESAIDLVKNGVTVTQSVLAQKLSVTQGAISKFARKLAGGWWFIKALFQTLLDSFSRGWNNLETMLEVLTEEERDWLDGYLDPYLEVAFHGKNSPEEETLILGFNTLLKHIKPGRVFALVRSLSIERQFQLLKYLIQITGLDIIDLSPHLHFLTT
jgi:hypothetical protein